MFRVQIPSRAKLRKLWTTLDRRRPGCHRSHSFLCWEARLKILRKPFISIIGVAASFLWFASAAAQNDAATIIR